MHIFDMKAVTSIFLICACMLLSRVSADPDEVENQEPNLLDEEDPYKTTDPRRREPSPCEGMIMMVQGIKNNICCTQCF